jgi:hypothetical protein
MEGEGTPEPMLQIRDILVPIRSADSYLWRMDPDPAKNYFFPSFFAYYFLKVHLHHFTKKVIKKSQNSRNLGSVADPDPGSGAFLTPGSGIRDG